MSIVPLHFEKHKDLKVLKADFSHVADQHMAPVTAHEIPAASADYPVFFVKNSDTGQFTTIALLGLEPGENLFVDNNQWDNTYVPELFAAFPFKLIPADDGSDRVTVAIIDDSGHVSTSKGEALFNEDGTETPYLAGRKELLKRTYEQSAMTPLFIQDLVKLDLFAERAMTLNIGGQKMTLDGLYFVDEDKLRAIDDEAFLDLRKRGLLPLIYAHLNSLHQMRRILSRKQRRASG
ncbi:peptidase [Kordiimonas sediminis]|uniref:Peptidase n=1 Tax=Kordiimonas sediminis TaxID=1735581 RepID=A0A919AKH9_9PROT|nr:SapC family protein [Kordiimonas sediminis]GHF13791.1 peptidase [Kordiimonas sediminis]